MRIPRITLLALAALTINVRAAEPTKLGLKTESFDRDPGWESFNNRITPKNPKTVVQDFGYGQTTHAAKTPGEIGGQISRASEPAFYALRIGSRTLDEKLRASGTFAVTKTSGSAGVFFGFFR